MSDSLNLVVLSGRLVEDPQLQEYNEGQTKLVRTRLATNYRRRIDKGDGEVEWESVGEYHTIEVWGNDAGFLSKYGKKGAPITITGRLKHGSYEDNSFKDSDNQSCTRYTTVVHVNINGLILPKMSSGQSVDDSQDDAPNMPIQEPQVEASVPF